MSSKQIATIASIASITLSALFTGCATSPASDQTISLADAEKALTCEPIRRVRGQRQVSGIYNVDPRNPRADVLRFRPVFECVKRKKTDPAWTKPGAQNVTYIVRGE